MELYLTDPDPWEVKLENYQRFHVYTLPNSYTDLIIFLFDPSPDMTK